MADDGKIKELVRAVKNYYDQKQVITNKKVDNDLKLLQYLKSIKDKGQQEDYSKSAADIDRKKGWKDSNKIFEMHKKQFKNLFLQNKELVSKNINAKISGYKDLRREDAVPEIKIIRSDKLSFNCKAQNILPKHAYNFDELRSYYEVNHSCDTGRGFADNYFRLTEELVGPDGYGVGMPTDSYYSVNRFLIHFEYVGYSHRNCVANFRALIHPNGAYYLRRYESESELGAALKMNAFLDISQFSPHGLQVYEGNRQSIIRQYRPGIAYGEPDCGGVALDCDGYLSGDIVLEHGGVIPIFPNHPFLVTAGFTTQAFIGVLCQSLLDIEINIPYVVGEIDYLEYN